MKRILTGLVLIFSVLGLIISGYSLAAHYDTNLYEVCTVNETFDCSSVNASEYSVIFGVPVAFLGIIGYAVIAILLLIFLVMILELINSAVEKFADVLKPRLDLQVQTVKDIMAGMVLLASLGAILIGLVIFYPHLVEVITRWW